MTNLPELTEEQIAQIVTNYIRRPDLKRDRMIAVRLTLGEEAHLRMLADQAGMTVSDYIRTSALGE